MRALGRLAGSGKIVIDGKAMGSVDYTIDIVYDGAMKSADGLLIGDARLLAAAFDAASVDLTLDNGARIVVILTSCRDSHATIRVNGPVPGF